VYYRKQQQWIPWLSVQKDELEYWLNFEEIDNGPNFPAQHEL
jgi:hypothetical protein